MMREHLLLARGTRGNASTVYHQPDDEIPEATNDPSEEMMNVSEDGFNRREGLTTNPKIFWPEAINQKFLDVAYNTRDEFGHHIECIAFLCGYQDQEGIHPTHLIFPAQQGNSSRVDDLGIQGQDTTLFMANTLSQSITQPGREYKLISWIHTHVRGTVVGFSSIDLHNHHGLDNHVSPGIFGTVYEITANRYMYHFEPYVLTEEGNVRADECLRTLGLTNQQHHECFDSRFYKSIKNQLYFNDDQIIVIDGRKSQPLEAQPSAFFEVPSEETVKSNHCRACKRSFPDTSALLYHVGRAKKCKPDYASEIHDFRSFLKKKRDKVFAKKHPQIVKDRQKKWESANKKDISKKKAKAYAEKKDRESYQPSNKRVKDFRLETRFGPIFPCMCCNRLKFKKGVRECTKERLLRYISPDIYDISVDDTYKRANKLYLCHTCHQSLFVCKKRPSNSVGNGLQFDRIPPPLRDMTDLERQLISKTMLFMKIRPLPRSRMDGITDRVINVPLLDADVSNTIASFPRTPDESHLVTVRLKRMLGLKNVHKEAFVRPFVLEQALDMLQSMGNPHYLNINRRARDDSEFLPTIPEVDEDSEEIDDVEGERNEIEAPQILDEQLHLSAFSTCMVPNDPQAQLIVNHTDCTIEKTVGDTTITLAPGENKVPTNFLRDPNYEGKAFPNLFPTGKFDLGHKRGQHLSTQRYFNQRALNVDQRCAKDSSWLLAAQYRDEMEKLEKQCNICFTRGSLTKTKEGIDVVQVKDGFAALRNIRGSPKYWQQARNELIAKVEQLGPFQCFFTLSCAEMRWTEVVTSILELGGHEICWDHWEKDMRDENIMVNGISLPKFLADQDINKASLLKDNVLLITRIFDDRVKNFIKHLVMKDGEGLLPVDFYTYRVEFQLRGMAHIHGCMWLNEKFLQPYRDPADPMRFNPANVGELIDKISTCSLPGETNPELDKIVRELQMHNHTKSCKKYTGNSCRFHYPRYPSDETLIARPILDGPDEDGSKKGLKAKAELILSKVKGALEDEIDERLSLDKFLEDLNISYEDYKWALSISTKGNKVVLKRTLAERFVNNYHPTYLLAWNANMDIQFCDDPYAIVTYITDYYGKDESGMGELLTAALRECKGASEKDKLKVLRKVYSTHRQIGACEATYRLISGLILKNSNVQTIFVQTGFPERRSRMMNKVGNDASSSEGESSDDEGNGISLEKTYKLAGEGGEYHGRFKKSISIHDRYAQRPKALERICLAQFASMYRLGKHKKGIDFEDGCSESTGEDVIFETREHLPQLVKLPNNLGTLRLRGMPAVLRIHNSKKKHGESHEYFFAEQMLFLPWRNEIKDLHRHNPVDCTNSFMDNLELISANKKAAFPFSDHSEEFLERLETVDISLDQRPSHLGEFLDIQAAQDNLDVAEELEDEPFSIQHPGSFADVAEAGDVNGRSDKSEKYRFREIDVSNPAELEHLARQLIPEQRVAFDKVHLYCTQVAQRTRIGDNRRVDPIRLIIHGGSGAGKSNVIRAISKHAEHLLRKAGDHPNKPRVALFAPTGMASHVIGGTTYHTGLGLNYGHNLIALSVQKLDKMRNDLDDLKLLIIDEMSMVSADTLYVIHERLCTIFRSTEPFAGKSIVLVGDLMQLQPVNGHYIFQRPTQEKNYHAYGLLELWEQFEVVILKHNHRQGEGNSWANTLNRLRMGIVEADDLKILKARVVHKKKAMEMSDALHLYFKNDDVDSYNTIRLNQLPGQLYSVKAMTSAPPGHKSKIDSSGRVDKTGFMKNLKFKIGSRVMLVHNIDLIDSLCNGMLGTVTGLKVNEENIVTCIIVKFDDPKVGRERRLEYPDLSAVGTPIFRTEFGYQLPSKKGFRHSASAKVNQFPLRLAWAVTIHKVQGQTFVKGTTVVIHWDNRFRPGMAYVALGRCESINDIYITEKFRADKIKCDLDALAMSQELERRAAQISGLRDIWFLGCQVVKVSFLNIRSLPRHHADLQRDSVLLASDAVCLAETWLCKDQSTDALQLPGYDLEAINVGQGKGVANYTRHTLLSGPSAAAVSASFQALRTRVSGVYIITVYRSDGFNIPEMALKVQELIDECSEEARIVIVGDFNFPGDEVNNFTYVLSRRGFKQIVKEPTHLGGRCIDHCYVKDPENVQLFQHSVYYSDHNALCVTLR